MTGRIREPDNSLTAGPSAGVAGCPMRSYVLHERARRFGGGTPAGWLSIKCMFGGGAIYRSEGATRFVDDECYLVLNHGQPYEIEIESRAEVESFCVFFEPAFALDVLRCATHGAAQLLDDPIGPGDRPPMFVARTFAHDRLLSPALRAMRRDAVAGRLNSANLEDRLRDVLVRLLRLHGLVRREIDAVPAVRGSTRHELYRRLHRGRDYLAAMIAAPVTLADAARVACMAPHHFHRTFRATFGCTPHEFQRQRRLDAAAKLLGDTTDRVTDICLAVGFESLGSFSTLFRRRFGRSPIEYRRAPRTGSRNPQD